MKKIIIILPTLPNYRRDFLNNLSKQLKTHCIDLTVYHGFTKKKTIKSLDNQEFKSKSFKTKEYSIGHITITFIKNLRQQIFEEKPDGIVILFNPAIISFINILLISHIKHIPYAIWSCGYIRSDLNSSLVKIRERILNFFDKRATAHIAYHNSRKKYLLDNGINGKAIFVAQNTIDTETIMNSYNLKNINENRYGNKLNILFVGALIKEKHLKEAMKAIDSLVSNGMNISFNIIGGGNIFSDLIQYQEMLTNKNSIHLLGAKYGEELKYYFFNSDVFLLTGSGGLAINEAMAYGLPVISTIGDGTILDLIENNGYILHNYGNVNEIKEAVTKFYLLSKEEKTAMSEKSLIVIREKATLSKMVENYSNAVLFLLNYPQFH